MRALIEVNHFFSEAPHFRGLTPLQLETHFGEKLLGISTGKDLGALKG